jgi:hypothetical protein
MSRLTVRVLGLGKGFPTIATSYLPLMLVGLWSARTGRRLGYMAAAYAALMSIPAHKEFRRAPVTSAIILHIHGAKAEHAAA